MALKMLRFLSAGATLILPGVLVALLCSTIVPGALADNSQPAAPPGQPGGKPKPKEKFYPPRTKPYKRNSKQFEFEALTKPPDLPYMPPWPTKYQFLSAAISLNAKGGPAGHVQFTCPDAMNAVLEYYHATLPPYQWKVVRETTRTIYATKQHSTLNIVVMPPSRPKMKCDLLVLYTDGSKIGNTRPQ